MKILFLYLVGCCCACTVFAQPLFQNQAIVVQQGALQYWLMYPQIFSGGETLFPVKVTPGREGAALEYPNGALGEIRAKKDTLEYTLTNAANVTGVKFFVWLPANSARDAKIRLSDHTEQELPLIKESPEKLFSTDVATFALLVPGGQIVEFSAESSGFKSVVARFEMVPGWHQNAGPAFLATQLYRLNPQAKQTIFWQMRESRNEAAAPVVDRFGQPFSLHFPGKVIDESELLRDSAAETQWNENFTPAPRGNFGGLLGSREKFDLKSTGFFRIAKVGDRDLLVTPDGEIFFQLGVCTVGPCDDYTYLKGRHSLYEWLPTTDGEFASAFLDRNPDHFSFYLANLIRKNRQPFDVNAWQSAQIDRLRRWGFNSLGAFGSLHAGGRAKQMPYTPTLPMQTIPTVTGRFFDPFDPRTAERLDREFAARIAPRATDPLIIGYFTANEERYTELPEQLARLDGSTAVRQKLAKFLRQRYLSMEEFNSAWNAKLASPDEFISAALPPCMTDSARRDMRQFAAIFLDRYFKLIAETFRKHDPNHLLLGARFVPMFANEFPESAVAAGKYCDVFSVNYYSRVIDGNYLTQLHELTGRPLLLSEWSFGTSEQGLTGGVIDVATQKERGEAYRAYLEQAAALPFVVGSQYFAYIDQALTGRWFQKYNGESMNIGLVNVADRPFRSFIEAAAQSNERIYNVMFAECPPFSAPPPVKKLRIPKNAHAAHAGPGVAVDGTPTGWPERPALRLGKDDLAAGISADGFQADVNFCWDEKNLYFFAVVRDGTPGVNPFERQELWRGDAFELFLGADAGQSGDKLLSTDRQLIVGATPETRSHWFHTPEQIPVETRYLPHRDNGGWTMEGAVPWQELGIKPHPGLKLRFDFGVDDAKDSRRRLRQFIWSGDEKNAQSRSSWGTLTLVR